MYSAMKYHRLTIDTHPTNHCSRMVASCVDLTEALLEGS